MTVERVDGVLSRWAERAYTSIERSPRERRIFRRILLDLVRFSGPEDRFGDAGRVIESQNLANEFEREQVEAVAAKLLEHRLIVVSPGAGPRPKAYELAHSNLIQIWPRYRTWIEEVRGDEVVFQDLRAETLRWLRFGREVEALARGRLLGEFQRWAEEHPARLSEEDRAFLGASREYEAQRADRHARRSKGSSATGSRITPHPFPAGGDSEGPWRIDLALDSTVLAQQELVAARPNSALLLEIDLPIDLEDDESTLGRTGDQPRDRKDERLFIEPNTALAMSSLIRLQTRRPASQVLERVLRNRLPDLAVPAIEAAVTHGSVVTEAVVNQLRKGLEIGSALKIMALCDSRFPDARVLDLVSYEAVRIVLTEMSASDEPKADAMVLGELAYNLAVKANALGRASEAEHHVQEAIRRLRTVASTGHDRARYALAKSLWLEALFAVADREFKRAYDQLAEALELLNRSDSANADKKVEVALAGIDLSRVAFHRGWPKIAFDVAAASVRALETLDKSLGSPTVQLGLVRARQVVSVMHLLSGRPDKALRSSGKAVECLCTLPVSGASLACTVATHGQHLFEAGRPDEASRAFDEALQLVRADRQEAPRLGHDTVEALASLLFLWIRFAESGAALRDATFAAIDLPAILRHHETSLRPSDFNLIGGRLVTLAHHLGRSEPEHARSWLRYCASLQAEPPRLANGYWRAIALNNLGNALGESAGSERSRDVLTTALELIRSLDGSSPEAHAFEEAVILNNRAVGLLMQGDTRPACEDLESARAVLERDLSGIGGSAGAWIGKNAHLACR